MTAIDPRELRNACGQFGTGVTIITTHCEGHDHGMTANAKLFGSIIELNGRFKFRDYNNTF